MRGNVVVMLVYEPTTDAEPFPLARVYDDFLAIAVAESAVLDAELRAEENAIADETLAAMQRIEIRRLREVLSLVVPGFGDHDRKGTSSKKVM